MSDIPASDVTGADSKFYSENMDTLVALISYLATMKNLSRSPTMIARTLGLEASKVIYALKHGKALFRESKGISSGSGEHFYTLHTRYGLRSQGDEDDGGDVARDPLTPDQISPLIEFVTRMAEQEHESRRMMTMVAEARDSARQSRQWSMITTIVAAGVALLVGVIEIAGK